MCRDPSDWMPPCALARVQPSDWTCIATCARSHASQANPPDIEWDYFDTNEARVQRDRLPENIEDAIFEARNNLRPSQTARWTPPPL